MLCPKCGMQNNDTDNLCKYCGVELQNLQQNINNQTTNNFQTINDSYNQQSGNTNMQLNNDNLNNYSGTYKLTLTRPKSFVGSLWNLNVCVDGKSYCKVKVNIRCIAENEHDFDTYLKCKDYEDKGYN